MYYFIVHFKHFELIFEMVELEERVVMIECIDNILKADDSKELLLKNSGKLVDSINNLETYLKTNIFKGQNKNSESQEYYTFRKNK